VKYSTGEEVRLWDRIEAWVGNPGIVVFSIDTNEFSVQFPHAHWSYLKSGIMIDTERARLIHFAEPGEDLTLTGRGGRPTPEEWAVLRRAQFGQVGTEWQSGAGSTVQIGSVNRNGQICCGHRGVPGTDHGQFAYRIECGNCGQVYGANGSDVHERRCPACQAGAAGIPF